MSFHPPASSWSTIPEPVFSRCESRFLISFAAVDWGMARASDSSFTETGDEAVKRTASTFAAVSDNISKRADEDILK